MSLLAMAIVLSGLIGQGKTEAAKPAEQESVRVLVIHATDTGRGSLSFDPTLSPLQSLFEGLPYDTFREAGFHEVAVPYGAETAVSINERYVLHCLLREETEDGEVDFEIHIDLEAGEKDIEALRVTGMAAPGQGVFFRGLEMEEGELIVAFSIADGAGEGGGAGAGQGEGQGAAGDGRGGPSNGRGRGQEGPSEDQDVPDRYMPFDMQPEPDDDTEEEIDLPALPGDTSGNLPPDLANVEGLLRALEEQDMREQQNARNRRYEVIIKGDWW